MIRLVAVWAVLSLSTSVASAQAPSSAQDRAAALFQQGSDAADAGRWEEAVASLRQARALDPRPSTLYALAVALENLRRFDEAREALAAYFSAASLHDERRDAATALHARLSESSGSDDWVPFLLLGSGGAIAVGGIVLAIVGHLAVANVQGAPAASEWADYRGEWEQSQVLAGIGWPLAVAGVALATVGLVVLVSSPSDGAVALRLTPEGAALRARF